MMIKKMQQSMDKHKKVYVSSSILLKCMFQMFIHLTYVFTLNFNCLKYLTFSNQVKI